MSNVLKIEKLISYIGEDDFQQLVENEPGMHVYIPKRFDGRFHDIKQRNKLIREDYYNGVDVPELSVKYGLSEAWVYKIIAKR
ncbi:hypothetical protein HYG86_11365 [Alkalicella caledoniensis]|uniref:Mor transcription activator domain-containing protein n=1 Tax=Alkalicella caledoniensis TaxID=2731377 RepID=A0A7G9W9F9_ALKCA|nr:Mor transcription activator family protein [Alkalicella caledoniensis]QNO15321.1 hypothetical protein HYG86_11365 [Alkalicella caledoniensis]